MTTSANGTPRKPTASKSTGHTPLSSPTSHSRRKLPSGASMYGGVAMTGSALKPLNNGWQVWSNSNNSKRTASLSSATSMTETHTPGNDSFRSSIPDGWSSPCPPAPWDMTSSPSGHADLSASPTRKDYGQMQDSPSRSYSLQQARQRQAAAAQVAALSGPRIVSLGQEDGNRRLDDPERQHKSSFSPRFDRGPVRATSPAKPSPSIASSHFAQQQPNGLPASMIHGDDFSLGLRNLTINDSELYSSLHTQYRPQQPVPSVTSMHGMPIPHVRPIPPMQPPPPRPTYGIYPQSDYPNYYTHHLPTGREQFTTVEYPYGYDSYQSTPDPTSIFISSAAPPAQSAASMYGGARPSGFYTAQPVLFPPPVPSHLSTPQLAVPNILESETYTTMPHQALIVTSMRHSSPSPHPYPSSGQIPLMMSVGGAMYGPAHTNTHHMHVYPRLRHNRRTDQVLTGTLRSPLLDEFRTNKSRKWELSEIFGYVVEFSGDQHGSRFIQQKLETATSDEFQAVFDEIVPHYALQLIQDVSGNYVVQKLLEHGTARQKSQLVNTMCGYVLVLSLQMYGCRVVQKAIEQITYEQQAALVSELETHVLRCVKDANGNHVIQKLIERVSPELLGFVSAFRGHVFELATHPYGCRVLQRCFEHINEDLSRPLIEELHRFSSNLMQDQFGNYVIQFVLEFGRPEDVRLVVSKLKGNFLAMARHKFASNVCEKALEKADSESRRVLIEEILNPKGDGVSPVTIMMKDQFANYVLQRSLKVAEDDQKKELAYQIRTQLTNLRKFANTHSKHLVSIERLLEKCTSTSGEA